MPPPCFQSLSVPLCGSVEQVSLQTGDRVSPTCKCSTSAASRQLELESSAKKIQSLESPNRGQLERTTVCVLMIATLKHCAQESPSAMCGKLWLKAKRPRNAKQTEVTYQHRRHKQCVIDAKTKTAEESMSRMKDVSIARRSCAGCACSGKVSVCCCHVSGEQRTSWQERSRLCLI